MSYLGGKGKESKDPMVKKILKLRDSLLESYDNKEDVHEACKGMYKCSKLADKECLEGILAKLEALKGKKGGSCCASGGSVSGGGARRSRKKSSKKSSRKKSSKK
jgi:hypothetical protein